MRPYLDLRSDALVAEQRGQGAGREGFGDKRVRARGVDADELRRSAEPSLHNLPGEVELALRIGRARDEHPVAGGRETEHGTRIGAMDGDTLPRGEIDIGEKSFVALHETTLEQRSGETHGWRQTSGKLCA